MCVHVGAATVPEVEEKSRRQVGEKAPSYVRENDVRENQWVRKHQQEDFDYYWARKGEEHRNQRNQVSRVTVRGMVVVVVGVRFRVMVRVTIKVGVRVRVRAIFLRVRG